MTLGACGGGGATDAERFCSNAIERTAAIVSPPMQTADDLNETLAFYREMTDLAPVAIEPQWRALLVLVETASTVVPEDPASMQRVAAQAYATEKSAFEVREWIARNCGHDIGPMATIVPQGSSPTTTLAPGVPTTIFESGG